MFSFLTDKVKGYILGTLLIASVTLGGYFWIENNGLNADLVAAESERSILESALTLTGAANKSLADQLTKSAGAAIITDNITQQLEAQRNELDKNFEGLRTLTQKRYVEIEKKYASMEKNDANAELRRVEIGLEQARGVWRMYCIAEPAAKECE